MSKPSLAGTVASNPTKSDSARELSPLSPPYFQFFSTSTPLGPSVLLSLLWCAGGLGGGLGWGGQRSTMPTSRGLNNLFLLILDTHIVSIPCPASLAGSSSASVLPLRMRTFPSQQWVQGSPGSTHKDTYNVSMSRTRMSKSQGIQWACWLIWIYLDLHQNQQPRSKARDRCCLAKRENLSHGALSFCFKRRSRASFVTSSFGCVCVGIRPSKRSNTPVHVVLKHTLQNPLAKKGRPKQACKEGGNKKSTWCKAAFSFIAWCWVAMYMYIYSSAMPVLQILPLCLRSITANHDKWKLLLSRVV